MKKHVFKTAIAVAIAASMGGHTPSRDPLVKTQHSKEMPSQMGKPSLARQEMRI